MVPGIKPQKSIGERIKKTISYFVSRLFLLAGLAAIIMIALALVEETYKRYQIQQEIDGLKTQADSMEGDNQYLKGLIQYFQTSEYQEKEAKEKLSMQKSDEKVILVKEAPPDPKESSPNYVPKTPPKEDDRTNPQRWWDYFFAL